jgi:S1-C subfamily serine protease
MRCCALTVFVASDFQVLNKDDGLLKSNVVLESGGSGGGQVNNSGEVIAINSMSKFVARINQGRPNEIQAEYASWGRSVAKLEAGHGLKP